MPPKAAPPPKRLLLGRPGTTLQMGIVGVPNAGKSTFFNCITRSAIPAANFPYCTIEPNTARVQVPDDRYDWLVDLYNPKSRDNYPWLQVTDIAGLCRNASDGEGLGNAFLGDVASVDGIFMMLRCFEDPEVQHVEGTVDPVRDIQIINEELLKKDLEWVTKRLESTRSIVTRGGQKDKKKELDILEKIFATVEAKKLVRTVDWNAEEVAVLNTLNLLTAKSVVYLANISQRDFLRKGNKFLGPVKAWVDANTPGEPLVPFSAEFEKKYLDCADEAARKEFMKDFPEGTKTVISRIAKIGFDALKLQYFFTAGADEVKAWIIRQGDLAPQAAGKIHTDMEKGFICAEVMHFPDLKEAGTEPAAKAAGKSRQQGRTYEVQDGDIMLFKFNAGAGMKGGKK
eukprot:TRINITY_DN32583_c0_g1_i1.p2 TRINITY_DN32583_c0_g1~~TRINITY_DN32583_c0_g1_i1.p2  ORF type:complete len:399 (-),score=121.40 TRINITY_DN32583_c0_g1_i1:248-1444(-)